MAPNRTQTPPYLTPEEVHTLLTARIDSTPLPCGGQGWKRRDDTTPPPASYNAQKVPILTIGKVQYPARRLMQWARTDGREWEMRPQFPQCAGPDAHRCMTHYALVRRGPDTQANDVNHASNQAVTALAEGDLAVAGNGRATLGGGGQAAVASIDGDGSEDGEVAGGQQRLPGLVDSQNEPLVQTQALVQGGAPAYVVGGGSTPGTSGQGWYKRARNRLGRRTHRFGRRHSHRKNLAVRLAAVAIVGVLATATFWAAHDRASRITVPSLTYEIPGRRTTPPPTPSTDPAQPTTAATPEPAPTTPAPAVSGPLLAPPVTCLPGPGRCPTLDKD